MFNNIVPQITSETGFVFEFDASLTINDQGIKVHLTIDDDGLRITTKKDNIYFHRSQWLDVSLIGNAVAFIVHGIGHSDWGKKRKFEKQNPEQAYEGFSAGVQSYTFTFTTKKLPESTTPAMLNQQIRRTYLLAYLDEVDDPVIIRCNDCYNTMDVTPHAPDDSLFCDNCSQVMGQPQDPSHGLCDGCGYYTKLVKQETAESGQVKISTKRICHRCRVKDAFLGFVIAVGAALGVGALNWLTLTFANRFFPVLILIVVVSLIWGVFKLVMVIVYSMARKAAGETPLENATNALRKGNTDRAIQIINSMEGDMTQNPGILLNLTRGLIISQDYEKASQFADSMIGAFPNFTQGYEEAVAIQFQSGNVPQGEQLLEQAIAVAARNQVRSIRRQKLLTETE